MILIISNEMDLSTDEVCQWLYHKNANYFRVNSQDSLYIENISVSKNQDFDITIFSTFKLYYFWGSLHSKYLPLF